jgi:osmotically inducible lipoprotein OsmB
MRIYDGVKSMFKRVSLTFAAAIMTLGAATIAADADSCSGRNHTTGTVVGAVGGGLIGNAITHGSAVGVVGGAVAGGLAGNAISRDSDCHNGSRYHQAARRDYYYDRHHRRHYYAHD